MIPAEFDYVAPESLDEALAALREGGEDAKLLAGGHSLLPLMKLRLAAPTLLVDLRRCPGCAASSATTAVEDRRDDPPRRRCAAARELGLAAAGGGHDRRPAGAQPRHDRRLARPRRPGLRPAGGAAGAEGSVTVRGAGGEREIAAARPVPGLPRRRRSATDEVITEVRLPAIDGYGLRLRRSSTAASRTGRWSPCARWSSAPPTARARTCASGSRNMGSTPLRAKAVEEALRGQPLDAERIAAAAEQAAEGTEPAGRPQRVRPTTSATWRGCSAGGRWRRRRARSVSAFRVNFASTDGRSRGPGGRGLPGRPGAGHGRVPRRRRSSSRCCSRARRAWARRRSRARSRPRGGARLIRLQCHEGIDLHHARLRLGLPAPAARDPRRRGGRRRARAVRARVPAAPPAARGARARRPRRCC